MPWFPTSFTKSWYSANLQGRLQTRRDLFAPLQEPGWDADREHSPSTGAVPERAEVRARVALSSQRAAVAYARSAMSSALASPRRPWRLSAQATLKHAAEEEGLPSAAM